MLTQLCRKKGVKCILYINYKPLPVAAAVKKAQHLLERGKVVTIMLEDRSVITAKSLKELRDKIAQLLK
jgi:sugar/nucleoside kinase (ribokinase family)